MAKPAAKLFARRHPLRSWLGQGFFPRQPALILGALIEYRRGLCRRGIEVRLANVPAQVWLALELAGLGKLFELIDLEEPTRPAANAVA